MAERTTPGPVSNIKDCEAVCIHTKKIYDSCRDKDIPHYKEFQGAAGPLEFLVLQRSTI